jgi:hypothetical protein
LLDNDEPTVEEDVTFYALVAILTLFISAVHDQQVQIYSILEKLKDSQQEKLERFFRYLLDNRNTMTKEKLKILLSSASPASSSQAGYSTPQSHRSNLGSISSTLNESFTYSPNSAKTSSPLQDFLQNHRNQQMFEKLQAEVREVKCCLDQEKSEAGDLRTEVSELRAANEKLKVDLQTTKSKLFNKTNGQHQSTTSTSIELEELQQKYLKKTSDLKFAVIDSGMNDLLRPSLYQAWHNISVVATNNQKELSYEVVGPVCESGDTFGEDRILSLNEDSILAIHDAGAYGHVMSSNYNSRLRPPEILVEGQEIKVIRRRETFDDLLRQERDV